MAETLAYQGYIKRAAARANEVLDIGREAGDAMLEALGLFWLGFVKRLSGRPEEAIVTFRQCAEVARSVPDQISRIQAASLIGHCYLDMGRLQEAMNALHEAERIRRDHKVFGVRFVALVRVAFARAYLMAAEREDGNGRQAKLAQAGRACREARKSAAKYRAFTAEAFRYQGTLDWLTGRQRQASQWWRKSLDPKTSPIASRITPLFISSRQS